jgi:serpin B
MRLLNFMKRIVPLTLWAAVTTAGAGPAGDQAALVAANTGFAFDLLTQITAADPAANVFISPYSVSSALQMTAAGAGGDTKAEMQRVLKTGGLAPDSLHAGYRDLNQALAGRTDVTLNLASGLWFQKGFHLKPAFAGINTDFFRAGLEPVDFGDPQSAKTINAWADRQTAGKIKDVVQYPFPQLTRLILANAIYFKGRWTEPFKKELTQPRPFHPAGGEPKQTPMMTQNGDFQYQETGEFQAVKLAYRGGLQMELYLPAANSNPAKLLPALAARERIASGFAGRAGVVTLPKFKMDYHVKLNGPLQALGMKSAFGRDADFSGIADEKLYIGEVLQKSYVDLNEEGTEAAAVTTVGMQASAVRMPPRDRFTMILDRPFFFVISDVATGSVLFMGIVNNPEGT